MARQIWVNQDVLVITMSYVDWATVRPYRFTLYRVDLDNIIL